MITIPTQDLDNKKKAGAELCQPQIKLEIVIKVVVVVVICSSLV